MLTNKYDFLILFDVENGNPNGDPDADNMPRIDPETNFGIVTDVCLKRKVRNYVDMAKSMGELGEGYDIYIQEKKPLNRVDAEAYKFANVELDDKGIVKDKKIDKEKLDISVRDFMCSNFFDIRTFGAVMTTHVKNNLNAGQVRGPVQLSFARSIDRIFPQNITITRGAVATEKDFLEKGSSTMGRKHIVPYGLYKAEGYISAPLTKSTGFNEDDLELLWQAITNMLEHDRAAARGKMSMRELIVFRHENALGNAPSHKLFDIIKIEKKTEDPPRSYNDYVLTIDETKIPAGITMERLI
ncbi:MAG: type I-C CRISPR-associated protein Cas7/Csd2 [Defluviitaleaceae bacterium]|nr:type I-C CRISPR-associated protein Cas7/Csd2 [Defluviitaleaceae bacterium]